MTKTPHETGQDEVAGWFAGRLPSEWFTGAPQVRIDREEILVLGTLSEPELPEGSGEDAAAAALAARIDGFREDTREHRMRIKQEEWLKDLREALTAVEQVRDEGPAS